MLVPNAAAFDHFRQPRLPPGRIPEPHHPLIGFFGVIGLAFDMALVAEIATRRPDWNLLMIGTRRPGLDYPDLAEPPLPGCRLL